MKLWFLMINGLFQSWINHRQGCKQKQLARADFVILFGHGLGTKFCLCKAIHQGYWEGWRKGNIEEARWVLLGGAWLPYPSILFPACTNSLNSLSNPLPPVLTTIHARPMPISFLLSHSILVPIHIQAFITFFSIACPPLNFSFLSSFHWQFPLFGAYEWNSLNLCRIRPSRC